MGAEFQGAKDLGLNAVGEGEGGMIWKNGIETCIISYKKRVASPGLMQDTGCLGLVHWDDPEGWYGQPHDHRLSRLICVYSAPRSVPTQPCEVRLADT